jgi:hypothetical protein
MRCYLLHHRHDPRECGAAYAAWRGFSSDLRRRSAASNCLFGGHAIWWRVEAADAHAALALLPPYVADRTSVTEIRLVTIP